MVMRTADKLITEQRAVTAPLTFDQLYARYFDFVWRSLRRLGVAAALVEDAAQDTFIVLHRRLDALREDASPKAFLFGIALRVANDYRRRARRKGASSLSDVHEPIARESPFEDLARTEAARLIERFLDQLEQERRAVFVLIELEGMTAPEVSEALSVNLSTVYTRLRAARQRFVEFLEEQGRGHG